MGKTFDRIKKALAVLLLNVKPVTTHLLIGLTH